MTTAHAFHVEGEGALAGALRGALGGPAPLPCLVHADATPDAEQVVARSHAFAASVPGGGEALLVTILHAAPAGLAQFARHAASASLWAFTRQAALDWAHRGIRVNAIGLGVAPFGPVEATAQSGRAAADAPAQPAGLDDLVRTLHIMAGLRSMTGQIVRLGAPVGPGQDSSPYAA